MTSAERKARLRRLSEMNKRSLGVSSFEDARPVVVPGSSVARELLAEIRQRKSCVCRSASMRSGCDCQDSRGSGRLAWRRKYYNL